MALDYDSGRGIRSMLAIFTFVLSAALLVFAGPLQASAQEGPVSVPIVDGVKASPVQETVPLDKSRDLGVGQVPIDSADGKLLDQNLETVPTIPRSKEPLRVKTLKTPDTSLSGIGTGTTPEDATEGRLPSPMSLPFGPDREAGWSLKYKHWVAPVYCHQPTYYEDVMLEYHGHERCQPVQPLLSGARFYGGIFFTPYLAYLRPPLVDIPSAGNYRPGSCAPALRQRAPYDPGAMKVQAAAAATGVLALQP